MTKRTTITTLFLILLSLTTTTTLVMAQEDQYGLLERSKWFSHGTFNVFASYVALISVCVGQYRQAAELSDYWSQSDELIMQSRRAIKWGMMEAIFIWSVLIVALGVLVPLVTKPLDPRMEYIIEATSRLTSAVLQGMLSLRVAIWIDLYGHPFWSPDSTLHKRVGTSYTELKHRVRWSVSKRILRMFFLLFLFFQGVEASTIPVSIICGLAFGFFVDFGIYFCRRWQSFWRRGCISLVFVSGMALFSILLFSSGVLYVSAVWESNVDDVIETTWDLWALLIGVIATPVVHITVWQLGKKNKIIIEEDDDNDGGGGDNNNRDSDASGKRRQMQKARMATSMIFSDLNIMKKVRESEKKELQQQAAMLQMDAIGEGDEDEEEDSDEDAEAKPESAIPPSVEKNTQTQNKVVLPDGPDPTTFELMLDWQCCGCARGDDKPTIRKIVNVCNWFFYLIMCAVCVFLLIVNAGATYQQEWTREKLPDVADLLYNNMNEGPVCAYDPVLGKDPSFPRTVEGGRDAAHAKNWSVLHCGACNHCSDWHNLELEYTTRKFLAEEGRNCAQQSLFGGGYPTLVECLENPEKIGWQGTCANCWADDIICTKDHCAFIGLQSFFINTLSNFAVGEDTITSAACEEAHCEAGNNGHTAPKPDEMLHYGTFVICSGANRRRMNVTSSIARPGAMQCEIVDVDWDELFPDLHPNDPDYKG